MMNPTQPPQTPFLPTSRYYGIATFTFLDRDNAAHAYVTRRFIAAPSQYATIELHIVREGERYDTLAATYLGDPEQFWRLADANVAMDPTDLERPGETIRITLPAGIPGYPGD